MPGLLDYLGYGSALPSLDQTGAEGGIGMLDEATMRRMRKQAGMYDRYGQGPTVASTGGATPALLPGAGSAPITTAPPGSVPGMGAGEAAVTPPVAPPVVPPVAPLPAAAAPAAAPVAPPQGGILGPMTQVPPSLPPGPSGWQAPAVRAAQASVPPPGSGAAPAPPPAIMAPPNLLNRVGNWLNLHSNQLMGAGAGIAGAPSIGTGISGALKGAMAGRAQDIGMEGLNASVQALIAKGATPAEAMAAAQDPRMMQAMLAKHFHQPTFQTITDMQGNQRLVLTDVGAGGGIVQSPVAVPPNTPRVNKIEEALQLPRGTVFIDPEGNPRVR